MGGRAGQLLPGRGRPAHARRHRPELRRARSTRSSARWPGTAAASRTSSASSSPTTTPTTRACSRSSSAARAPRSARSTSPRTGWRTGRASMKADDAHAAALMREHGVADEVVSVLEAMAQGFRAWGGSAAVDTPLTDGGTLAFADRTWTVHHRPGHSCDGHRLPRPRAARGDRRRPPARPHLLQPARVQGPGRGAGQLPALAAHDAGDGGPRHRAPRPRRHRHRPARADRDAPGDARAARAQDRRDARRRPAVRARDRPLACGAPRRSPRRS